MARSAEGIPDRGKYGRLTGLEPGTLATISYQLHEAERAGRHYDFRIGTEETGLLSWATRKGLPRPGERYAYFRQPVHSFDYGTFSGEIPSGYGKGKVTLLRYGNVLVTDVGPRHVRFSMSDGAGRVNRYLLRKVGPDFWLMMNVTPRINYGTRPRVVYIPSDTIDSILDDVRSRERAVRSRGVRSFIQLVRKGAEILPAQGRDVLTEKVLWREARGRVPRELEGTMILAEVVGRTPKRELTPAEVSALLEAPLEESLRKQRELQATLSVVPVSEGVLPGGGSAPSEEVERTLQSLLGSRLLRPEPPQNRNEPAYIPAGREVRLVPGHNQKVLYIRDFDIGLDENDQPIVRAIHYSHRPNGPVVGSFGAGIPPEIARRMAMRPGQYIGRPVLVRYAKDLGQGKLRGAEFVKVAGSD